MTLTSASKLWLAELCLGSAVLPGVEYQSKYGTLGVVKHRFLERALDVGRDAALAEVPEEHRDACADLDIENLPASQRGAWAAEVAYAIDVVTGEARELGRGLGRRYAEAGLRPTEIPGTIDLVGISADGESVVVPDYKTGHRAVEHPSTNLQSLFAAVAAAKVLGKHSAHAGVLRVSEEGEAHYLWAHLDALDLDEAWTRIQALGQAMLEARRVAPKLVVGEHCERCPAIASCPAQGALVRRMVSEPGAVESELLAALTPELAAQAHEQIQAAKAVLEKVEQALYAFAAKSPVPLPSGLVLGPVETSREYLLGPIARKVLVEKYGADVAEASVEFAATKASLKRGLRIVATAENKKITHLEKEALAHIRAAQGVEVKTSRSVKVHKPGAATEAA